MDGNLNLGDIVAKLTENPELLRGIMNAADSMKSRSGDGDRGGDKKPKTSRWTDDDNDDDNNDSDKRPKTSRWTDGGDSEKENRDRLLLSLRPYLGETRRNKVELVLKIMKILEISELGGLFKNSD